MLITLETLISLDACAEARRAFTAAFPNGAANWQAVSAHPDCRRPWKWWIATHAPGLALEERLSLADQSNEPDYWRWWIAIRAPGLSLEERLSLASQSYDRELRWLVAIHAPGLVLEERLALVDQSDNPDWKCMVAVHTVGLSIEERLAIADQSDRPDYWRSWINERYAASSA